MLRPIVIAIVLSVLSVPAMAQRAGGASADRVPDSAARARLEGEVRRGFARAVRDRVGLSEDQMRRLVPLSRTHEQQRRRLQLDERRTRVSLRAALRDDRTADSAKVAQLLEDLVEIQKRRVQLLEAEQRDLATIMTPMQRARYMALQEQVRRRLEQMRNRRAP